MYLKTIKDVKNSIIDIFVDSSDEPFGIHFSHTDYLALTYEEANELQAKLGFALQEYERTRKIS